MNIGINTRLRACRTVVAAIGIFAILFILAMAFYPGGYEGNPGRNGYSFLLNYFSDTGRTISYGGEINTPSMIFFTAALVLVNLALGFFHLALIGDFQDRKDRWGILAAVLGLTSAAGALFIPVFPENLNPEGHMAATMAFSNALLLSLIAYAVSAKKDPGMPPGVFRAIIAYVAYLASYLAMILCGTGLPADVLHAVLAGGQKIAIIAGFLCLAVLASGTGRRLVTGVDGGEPSD